MKRIAVFASGEGSNFEAIAAACERGAIAAEVALVVCDRPGARVTERAAARGIACFAFAPKEYASKADYEREIVARLDAAGVDLVCLAGGSSTSIPRCCPPSRGRTRSRRPSPTG